MIHSKMILSYGFLNQTYGGYFLYFILDYNLFNLY